jgi:hypothetical protein
VIHVIQESSQIRTVVTKRIEGLNDILLPTFSVLRCGRQGTQMDTQILTPILDVLLRSGLVRVAAHPSPNVLRKPHVKFLEILRDNKPIVSDVMSVHEHDRIAGIALLRE